MPQDIRVSPDGKLFFVADMMSDGVYVVDGETFRQIEFIPTGIGAHGLYPEPRRQEALCRQPRLEQDPRAAARARAACRCSTSRRARSKRPGRSPAAAARTWATSAPTASCSGSSGRYDNVVYAIDTGNGSVTHDPGRHGAARPHRLAAAGPLLARPHRQHALAPILRWDRLFAPRHAQARREPSPRRHPLPCVTSLVVTVIGPDRPGLVSLLSDRGKAHGASWAESRMASLAGQFAGMVRFEVDAAQRRGAGAPR